MALRVVEKAVVAKATLYGFVYWFSKRKKRRTNRHEEALRTLWQSHIRLTKTQGKNFVKRGAYIRNFIDEANSLKKEIIKEM